MERLVGEIERSFAEVEERLQDPAILGDQRQLADLGRRHSRLSDASAPSDSGGFKDITFSIAGDGAFSLFKWESGVHRVQRVPATESQGRIHTSTATVAVLPEAEEVEVVLDPKELTIETIRGWGPG